MCDYKCSRARNGTGGDKKGRKRKGGANGSGKAKTGKKCKQIVKTPKKVKKFSIFLPFCLEKFLWIVYYIDNG